VSLSRTTFIAMGGGALSAVLVMVLVSTQGRTWGSEFAGIVAILVAVLLCILLQAFEISRSASEPPKDPVTRRGLHVLLVTGAAVAAGSVWYSISAGPHGLLAPFGLFVQLATNIIGRHQFAT
jgi:hypothetical protein